ncbi:hypothetical protein D3C76_594520 [compost metagenome]
MPPRCRRESPTPWVRPSRQGGRPKRPSIQTELLLLRQLQRPPLSAPLRAEGTFGSELRYRAPQSPLAQQEWWQSEPSVDQLSPPAVLPQLGQCAQHGQPAPPARPVQFSQRSWSAQQHRRRPWPQPPGPSFQPAQSARSQSQRLSRFALPCHPGMPEWRC